MPKRKKVTKPKDMPITSSLRNHLVTNSNPIPQSYYVRLLWLGGLLTSFIVVVMYYLNRREADHALQVSTQFPPRTRVTESSASFFQPSTNIQIVNDVDESWLTTLRFDLDQMFNHPDPKLTAENKRVFADEVQAQKLLLKSLPLSSASKAALANASIRMVPAKTLQGATGKLLVANGELLYALLDYMTPEERRQTLVNELHHLTIRYINLNKFNEGVKVEGMKLIYPFLNEQGEIDTELKKELNHALEKFEKNLNEFSISFPQLYLETLIDYQPQVYRMVMSDQELAAAILSKTIEVSSNEKLNLKLPDGSRAFGHIHDIYGDQYTIIYSLARDRSLKNLAKAFVHDYHSKLLALGYQYKAVYSQHEQKMSDDDLLMEKCSDLDELLTPRMKEVFAKEFKKYFDHYTELGHSLLMKVIYK